MTVTLPPFQSLLDAHGHDVHRFLVATVGRPDADDCYQETWLAALRAYPRLRDGRNLRSWIFTVAHHKALDHIRAARRRPAVLVAEVPEPSAARARVGAQSGAGTEAVADGQPELWASVRRLPAKQRAAVALRFIFDWDHAEIGRAMETSAEAARRNVHEGLKRLRTEYDHERE